MSNATTVNSRLLVYIVSLKANAHATKQDTLCSVTVTLLETAMYTYYVTLLRCLSAAFMPCFAIYQLSEAQHCMCMLGTAVTGFYSRCESQYVCGTSAVRLHADQHRVCTGLRFGPRGNRDTFVTSGWYADVAVLLLKTAVALHRRKGLTRPLQSLSTLQRREVLVVEAQDMQVSFGYRWKAVIQGSPSVPKLGLRILSLECARPAQHETDSGRISGLNIMITSLLARQ